MKLFSCAAVLLAALGAAIVVPVPRGITPACVSPVEAAAAGERAIPSFGLGWGRVRGWRRLADGWEVVWQPSHGAWLLRARLADGRGEPRWGLDAAPWLPGARLSRAAARLMLGRAPLPQWRLGRRDWVARDRRLIGALPGGRMPPARRPGRESPWAALVVGLLLAGAVSRALQPGPTSYGWRRAVWWTALAVTAFLPWAAPLAVRGFRAGVRPWVGELVFGSVAALLLGALALAALRYPAAPGHAPATLLACALAAGLLAGRLAPVPWAADVAGLSIHALLWVAIAVLGGWLGGLAGDGLRQLLALFRGAGTWLLAGLAVIAVATAGAWLGPLLAVLGGAAGGRGRATWLAAAVSAGWVVGATWATCEWAAPVRDSLLMLLLACTFVFVTGLAERRGPRMGGGSRRAGRASVAT
jgi:hypothetical protein